MMRTWLKPVLELMTAEHRAMAFDLFCDWRAWKCLRRSQISPVVHLCPCINSPHCSFLLPACLHEWSLCPFQPWPGANRHERCVHFLMLLRDNDKAGNVLRHSSSGEGHLEGGQAVQTREVLYVSCCNVETCTMPRTAHMSFWQHTCNDRNKIIILLILTWILTVLKPLPTTYHWPLTRGAP